MGIVIVSIVAGSVVLITFCATLFDYLGKRHRGANPQIEARLAALERRLGEQDQAALERDQAVQKLEGELSFMTNLLESRSKPAAP